MAPATFRVEASFDDVSGRMVAVYLRVREGVVAETREPKEGYAYADYSADGELLGVELLGPCDADILESLGRNEPEPVQRFLRDSVPGAFVTSPALPRALAE